MLDERIAWWYFQKSAEVIVSRQRATALNKGNVEDSQKDEGLNVRIGEAIKEV